MSTTETHTSDKKSLDAVLEKFKLWRKNKGEHGQGNFPDDLLLSMFDLESEYQPKLLRQLFGLNKKQYELHRQRLINSSQDQENLPPQKQKSQTPPAEAALDVDNTFSEVRVDETTTDTVIPVPPPLTAESIKQIKSTRSVEDFLDPTTVVVEIFRADGVRMTIHTVTQGAQALVHDFLGKVEVSSC